jgi:DNA (cytosine-5)-methyltransferase 1
MDKDFSAQRQDAGLNIRECPEILEDSASTIYRYESGNSQPRVSEFQALTGLPKRKAGRPKSRNAESWFTFSDLFAGIGGLRREFDAIGSRCMFTSAWAKYAVHLRKNYLRKCRYSQLIWSFD